MASDPGELTVTEEVGHLRLVVNFLVIVLQMA